MKLSVIICCYNERASILDVIQKTQAVQLGPGWEREILVVDNFSTDGTRELLQAIDDPEIRIFYHERNMGKGMSIRTGIANMTGDYMLIQDADTEYDPFEHPRFCQRAVETRAAAILVRACSMARRTMNMPTPTGVCVFCLRLTICSSAAI